MIRVEIQREWPKGLRKKRGDSANFNPSLEPTIDAAKQWVKDLAAGGAFENGYALKRVTFYDQDAFHAELMKHEFKNGPFRPTFIEQHTAITW